LCNELTVKSNFNFWVGFISWIKKLGTYQKKQEHSFYMFWGIRSVLIIKQKKNPLWSGNWALANGSRTVKVKQTF